MSSLWLRATILGGLAALVLATHVFVDIDRVRFNVLAAPAEPAAGLVRILITAARFPDVTRLRAPFALIARIENRAETSAFSLAIDGSRVCERSVVPGEVRRIDCSVTGAWDPAADHAFTIQGPSGPWALASFELATHHGNTSGAHYVVVLPRTSTYYRAPSIGWVLAAWLLIAAAFLFLPGAVRMPRWVSLLYWVVTGTIVAEFALCLLSPWISEYRIVLSAGTFTLWMALLFAPRLSAIPEAFKRRGLPYLRARPAVRRSVAFTMAGLLLAGAGAPTWQPFVGKLIAQIQSRRARQRLYNALQPIRLANCDFKRFGEENDGGYVLCANLLSSVTSAYSYGISGYDQWGCDVSLALSVPVHEYDCFNLQRPVCAGGRPMFHEECVGTDASTIDGRFFDSVEHQLVKNEDTGKQLVVKMDVEGAEWDALLQANDAVLDRIDQLTIEMHMDTMQDYDRFTAVVEKLKRFFYVTNLHYNNFACHNDVAPFPANVYEVLFVSKRLGRPAGEGRGGAPSSVIAPNNPALNDCQALADLSPARK